MQRRSNTPDEFKTTILGETFILRSFSLYKRRLKVKELGELQRHFQSTGDTADYDAILKKAAEFIIRVENYEGTPLQFFTDEVMRNDDLSLIIDSVSLYGILDEQTLKNLHSSSESDTEAAAGNVQTDAASDPEPALKVDQQPKS